MWVFVPTHPDPLELTLEVVPRARLDLIDLRQTASVLYGDVLSAYQHHLFWSSHTTAGFLDRGLMARLGPSGAAAYAEAFTKVFPAGAGYKHDQLDHRTDLDPQQRAVEPRNADSHLAFIASGLRTCVTWPGEPAHPVMLIDLDGVCDGRARRRTAKIIGFQRSEEVAKLRFEVPVSGHPVDSINLKDPRLGIYERLSEQIARYGVDKGRIRLALNPAESHAGITVNEHETLLMRHDVAEVVRDPLRFALEKARHALADPRAVPGKTVGYAQYDLVRVLNQLVDRLGLSQSRLERLMARTVAVPFSRFFRMKRSVDLLVSAGPDGRAGIVEGTYQSPIMVQWQPPRRQARVIEATLTRLR
jgi:hypothetical protein